MKEPAIISIPTAAKRAGVSTAVIRALIADERISAIVIRKRTFVLAEPFERFLDGSG